METHLLSLLLLAATIAATADEPTTPPAITLPGCQDRCGDVSIPYPFGTKDGCFLPGFEVTCNTTMVPPRPFLAADTRISANPTTATKPFMVVRDYSYSGTAANRLINESVTPVELMEILPEGQVRVRGGFSFDCSLNETFHSLRIQLAYFPAGKTTATPFRLSEANRLTVVGCSAVEAELKLDNFSQQVRTGGSCSGKGWCAVDMIPYTSSTEVTLKRRGDAGGGALWSTSPCFYGMVVEKSWYNYSGGDLEGDSFLRRNVAGGVPVLLDFAVSNGSCPAPGEPNPPGYACASRNSWCVDSKTTYQGHTCICSDGYQGNPYISDGCQDIDECKQPSLYPCHGICENFPGGYNCTCPVGTRGNGKDEHCMELFPLPAKVSIGAIGVLFVASVFICVILLRNEKKKMRDFFEKNGGSYILENATKLKIYRWGELKPILKSSNFVGKGCFGEVYKGFLQKELVAVKKSIDNSATNNEQFANEVTIQSLLIHKNIVKLIGCCLEVEVPILVYEFVSKGSLDEVLHRNKKNPLDLRKRLNIAIESAEGLAYMHSQVTTKILHGDIKPANILLDDKFVPKISDFGISRLIATDEQHAKNVIGDMSYMDPIYFQTGLLTHKSDVYSFGVVLLELISRRKATYFENNNIVSDFLTTHKKGICANELFDKEIAVSEDLQLLNSILAIAMECLNLDVEQRPEMKEVEHRLRMLKKSCVNEVSSSGERIDDVK